MPAGGTPPHENGVGTSYPRRGPALGVRPSLSLVRSARERTWSRPRLDSRRTPPCLPPASGGARRGNCSTLEVDPTARTGPDCERPPMDLIHDCCAVLAV